MRKGFLELRGISRPPSRGRTLPARRLPPKRDSGRRRCESGRPPSAPTRAETNDRKAPSHRQFHHWPNLDLPIHLQDWAALRKLDGLLQIAGLDERIAADDVLGLGEGPIGHRFLL